MRYLFLVLFPATAFAQLRDPVPAEDIPDGNALSIAGTALAETNTGQDQVTGELAAQWSWTRAGVDYTQGFRGPRWTNRYGAAISLRASGGGDSPIEIEQRGEVALYVGSIGELVRWRSRSRMVDRFWYRTTESAEVGAFTDFGGLGLVVKQDHGHDLSAEAFPFYFEVARDLDKPITTMELDIAQVRVVGVPGDLRIGDERITIRDVGALRAAALDFAFFSGRGVAIDGEDSPWRVSGAIGLSALTPFGTERDPLQDAPSVVPYVELGIEHRGATVLRSTRSEIGRPLIDNADFGVNAATLHRSTDTGIDAGGQLVAWWQRSLDNNLDVHGEGLFGIAVHRLAFDGMPVSNRPFVIARADVGVTAKLGHGLALETRAWCERSERLSSTRRLEAGLSTGLAFHH